ncbi:septal ring lytic transglycosylase RlpA family protein [Bacteroidota bacterium]
MKKLQTLIPLVLLISIMGLKLLPNNKEKTESNISVAKKQNSDISKNLTNQAKVEFQELGIMNASWYGPRFHGRLTASGEIYDQNGFTAAHKNMPFGTMLKLTNESNNRSVVVRVNDRGPYIPGRQIDLSKRVAMELGTYQKGVVKIKVEKIKITGVSSPLIY